MSIRRVAQRTAELAAVNDELRKEIAERHRAEEALLENELNSRLILNSIPGLVCTMSPAGEVDRFNPQILEYFGKTPEELKGWATSDAVHPDDLPRVVAAFTHSITTGTPYDIEHRCRRASKMPKPKRLWAKGGKIFRSDAGRWQDDRALFNRLRPRVMRPPIA